MPKNKKSAKEQPTMTKVNKTYMEKIASKDEQIQQLLNQKKQLIQKQKADERKVKIKRQCYRHGVLEKHMPELVTLTDEQYEAYIKKYFLTAPKVGEWLKESANYHSQSVTSQTDSI